MSVPHMGSFAANGNNTLNSSDPADKGDFKKRHRDLTKGRYQDGKHERVNIVAYRDNEFPTLMAGFQPKLQEFYIKPGQKGPSLPTSNPARRKPDFPQRIRTNQHTIRMMDVLKCSRLVNSYLQVSLCALPYNNIPTAGRNIHRTIRQGHDLGCCTVI
jgi:hypothetical protein